MLEEALRTFPGTVLAVSHDRYFLRRIATRVLEMGGGRVNDYEGDYEYYLNRNDAAAERQAEKDEQAREVEKSQIKAKSKMSKAEKARMAADKTRLSISSRVGLRSRRRAPCAAVLCGGGGSDGCVLPTCRRVQPGSPVSPPFFRMRRWRIRRTRRGLSKKPPRQRPRGRRSRRRAAAARRRQRASRACSRGLRAPLPGQPGDDDRSSPGRGDGVTCCCRMINFRCY